MAVPILTPDTTPVPATTVATAPSLLLHTPPLTAVLSVVVHTSHTVSVPAIELGAADIVTTAVTRQVDDVAYVMIDVPALTPVTTPVPDTTVALAGLLLLHVPPLVALLSVVVVPIQADSVPPIAPGAAVTVTSRVATQPLPVW